MIVSATPARLKTEMAPPVLVAVLPAKVVPLTVSAPDWDRWLDPDAPVDEGLLRGHGDLHRIAVREVSTLVNSIRNNGPELIEPAEPHAEQAELF